jgi:predicted permease
MHPLRGIRRRVRAWFDRATFEAEMAEEIRLHLEQRIEQHIHAGLSPREARSAALRAFGGVARIQDECRDERRFACMERLERDVRHAVRQLKREPGFATVAVLTLALGISANTVVFSVAQAVLFRPLGFEAPDRLMWIRLSNTRTGVTEDRLSWRDIQDIRESTGSFESLATFGVRRATWQQGDRVEELPALAVTPNLAEVLRIRPAFGRPLLPSDADELAAPVVLVSHELWQARFGGAPGIIGQTLRLNDRTHTVVGVLPPGLEFPLERAPSAGTGSTLTAGLQSFWFPMAVQGEDRVSRDARMFLPVGRLRADVTTTAASAELVALGHRLSRDHPETNRGWSFELVSFRDQILGRTRQGIVLLAVAVAAVLLTCCVNLANLLLARGVARQRERAVRLALGASRGRLVQAFIVETMLLSLVGGALGIVLAEGALQGVHVLAPEHVPFIHEATVDRAALVFSAAVSLMTALVFGLLPAMRQSRVDATESLRAGTRTTDGPQIRAWQHGLLIGQIAVVLVLLASAGLLLESFRRLIGQDLGYQPHSVIALDLSTRGFQNNQEVSRLYRALHVRLAALPGVQAVGTVSSAPLTGKWTFDEKVQVVGRPVPETDRPSLAATFVAFDYFAAMGIPLIEGRVFREAELNDEGFGRLVVINEAAALLFPGRSAVGGRLTVGTRTVEVVGVVKDTRDVRLEEQPQPRVYWHYAFGGAQVVVRSVVPPRVLMPLLRDTVLPIDRRIVIREIAPMTEIVSRTVAERRFLMVMLAAYAVVALGTAAVGIFGVVACQVAQRRREFGVRLALGASPRRLSRLVLMQAGRVALAGLAVGLAISLASNRLFASQLFGVSPDDPVLLMTVSLILLAVTLLASLLPARRAGRVDPMEPLRCE